MNKKPIVFVITPFGEDYLALYDELKKSYEDDFEFTNGGDLDNQQNILQDIVEGIYKANVIIADLTGLNPNVFYELGLAHAMNKKVIIITQDLSELPFDIRSYRANEYSLQFNKLPKLKDELKKLLNGAIDNSVKYGNPVFDYIPYLEPNIDEKVDFSKTSEIIHNISSVTEAEEEGERGFIDYIADIQEHSELVVMEINSLDEELSEMNKSIELTSEEIDRVNKQSGSVDATFARKVCRKLAGPVEKFSRQLEKHVDNITMQWSIVENSYLSLLDNPYVQTEENITSLHNSITELKGLQYSINMSDKQVEELISALKDNMGIERKLNKSMSLLIKQLEKYLSMTETMRSSFERIISKSEIVKNSISSNL